MAEDLIESPGITVKVVMTGKAPLVMHHARTADPDEPLQIAISEIIAKKAKMTAEDRKRKEQLQWRAGLYTEDVKHDGESEPRETLIVPTICLHRAYEEGGKTLGSGTSSKGAAAFRSITMTETYMILDYDGPQDIAALATDPHYRLRTLVNPNPTGGRKVKLPSVRPMFPTWRLTTILDVVTDMGLSWADFEKVVRAAGQIGIMDARKIGYGRFSTRITKLH